MVGFSPSALQLKMASELNLMDMLDASAQQLNEMEHARTIALAHEESAALARILEGRQKDYERQLQLLSLKSQQEVEDAHRQLREVRQEYAHEAMELEKQQTKAQQDAAELRRAAADRLLQSQAETSRITAEAAKQLAEVITFFILRKSFVSCHICRYFPWYPSDNPSHPPPPARRKQHIDIICTEEQK